MDALQPDMPCPCGSALAYKECCGPVHAQIGRAATAEALMRARYCAFVLGDEAFLQASWHPRTRPETIQPPPVQWLGLTVLQRVAGGPDDDEGRVAFAARYRDQAQQVQELREDSRFLREGGQWYYLDGRPMPLRSRERPGRNEPCPCGSGKKFKRCCGP